MTQVRSNLRKVDRIRLGVGSEEVVSGHNRRTRQGRQAGKGWWGGQAEKGKRRSMEGLRGRQDAREEGGKREGRGKKENQSSQMM